MNLRDIPIRNKMRFVILTTCALALLFACGILFAFQFYFFRKDFRADVSSFAATLASRLPPSIDFENRERAAEILASLGVKPHFTGAVVVTNDGAEFARYRTVSIDPAGLSRPEGASLLEQGRFLVSVEPIQTRGDRLGTLFVIADYGSQASRLLSLYLAISCGVLTLSVLVAMLISSRLARFVTGPLERLAATVGNIAGSNDYSLRATKNSDDEVGQFTDSFNQMIERIQGRDAALRHEIAERERAEGALQNLHAQLLAASHQAGMAEVATGVLHNVGNVLNSVNVSATLVAEKLSVHRLNNLVRTAEMLRDKNGDLGDFLVNDSKGRLIPGYLCDLSKHLAAERQDALVELDLLTKNIEHIKEIVSMQQNYARVAGIIEQLSPESLVEDALRMTTGSLQRHHIEIVREYECDGLVTIERHKALQILVNLIRNAKHAMDEASPATKTLTLRIHESSGGFVAISISDNGVGIDSDNLTKIFSHGFTTRKDGHGFGLHSAALAAQQMGGSVSAQSPGVGHGATFSLELPITRRESATA